MAGTKSSSHRKRVFIIGAGVSASCDIPIARDILRSAILALRQRSAADAKRVHDLLRFIYPAFDEELGNYPNIEDFLNFIEVARDFNKEFVESTTWPADKLRRVNKITLKAVTDFIWSLMADSKKQHAVHDFVRNTLVREILLLPLIGTSRWRGRWKTIPTTPASSIDTRGKDEMNLYC
jgi:hypothetical protein